MLKKRVVFLILLSSIISASSLFAEEVHIVNFLKDPGFEAAHKKNEQLNAPGASSLNGWSATPKNSNVWTSVNYMSKKGMAPGDSRPGIAPAEGKSYLRMLTVNSSSWLALHSPEFQLKSGATYIVCFQVAADNMPPMGTLQVFLAAAGKDYCLKSFDTSKLKKGWKTVVYKVTYNGPEQKGFLRIRGRRAAGSKSASLCIDNFKTPVAADYKKSLPAMN